MKKGFMNSKRIIAILIMALFVVTITSCKVFRVTEDIPKEYVIFPSPPDTARIQFLTQISTSRSIVGEQSKFNKFIFGEEQPKQIGKPLGLAIRYGKIYICDTNADGLVIIDLENKTFDYFKPGGEGELKLPLGCYVDEKSYLYIADAKRQQIVVFDSKGKYLTAFGEIENFKPTDVYVSEGKIFVANVVNHAVYVYDRDTYKFLNKFPEVDSGEEAFLKQPTSLWITDDKVYVTDFGDFKVKVYSKKNNKYIRTVGSYGRKAGQLVRPKGIATDRESFLYIVDAAYENVQIFDPEGKILLFFGGPYTGPGYMYLPYGITIDYENLKYFNKYVNPKYELKYLIFVTNQYGPDKLTVYGRVELKKEN